MGKNPHEGLQRHVHEVRIGAEQLRRHAIHLSQNVVRPAPQRARASAKPHEQQPSGLPIYTREKSVSPHACAPERRGVFFVPVKRVANAINREMCLETSGEVSRQKVVSDERAAQEAVAPSVVARWWVAWH